MKKMFMTKQEFEIALRVAKAYENYSEESEIKNVVAIGYAMELFKSFNSMSDADQEEVLNMILQEISVESYTLN